MTAMLRVDVPLTAWLGRCSTGSDELSPALNAEDGVRFLRILSQPRLIRRQSDLLAWLNGDAQQFLPHQVLIAAWGDFSRWNVKSELVSSLPGVRAFPGRCEIDELLREAHVQWIRGARYPLLLDAAATPALRKPCVCPLHAAFRAMRSVLVHGVSDKRSGCDSLYLALDCRDFARPHGHLTFLALAHLLLCQVDIAWRRLAAFRLSDLPADPIAVPGALDLSSREQEILGRLSRGSTNNDIAEALDISLFTVKNHLKRIFRKIGVTNRTQAAARYNEALTYSLKNAQA